MQANLVWWKNIMKKISDYKFEHINIINFNLMINDINKLREENKKLKEALEFTTWAAEYLFKPNRPLPNDLVPTFYHTLTYEGDLELINKTKQAKKILEEANESSIHS